MTKRLKLHRYLMLIILTGLLAYVFQNLILTEDVLIDHLASQLSIDRIQQLLDSETNGRGSIM